MASLAFVVPIRHQDNARDWTVVKAQLRQTARSIAGQTHDDWTAVVVANEGADLPELPPRFRVERVAFPPNLQHERGDRPIEDFYDAFRADKGRRVLAGMLALRDSRFFMIVDGDDLVSDRLAAHVAGLPDANGWLVRRGWVWNSDGRLLFAHDDFNGICGTSLIVRADLYRLPQRAEDAPLSWIKASLGSHRSLAKDLAAAGTPLAELPFRGAVYRVASSESHSGTPSFFRKYLTIRRITRLRVAGAAWRREFLGERLP